MAASNCTLQERASLIDERGGFLLEVLGLVLTVVVKVPSASPEGGLIPPVGIADNPELVRNTVVHFLLQCVCEEASDQVRIVCY
jgi:hypothetical protein